MTLSTMSGQVEQPRPPRNLPNLRGAVINIWLGGGHDTVDLARRFHITEAEAYNFIATRRGPMPGRVERVAFAGKPSRSKSAVKPLVVPSSRPAGCKYRLREGLFYLHQSGSAKTPDPKFAWEGSADQAIACCTKFPLAANMSMELVL